MSFEAIRRRAPSGARATPLLLAAAWACAEGGAAPTVEAPLVLATGRASNPTVAFQPGGSVAFVAWVETGESGSNVLLSRLDEGGQPSAPVRVNDVEGDAAPHLQAPPRVAVGPEGNVYVAWQNNTHIPGRMYPASDLRFARSTDGGRTFQPAFTVNEDAGGPPASHTFHDLIVTAAGEVVISWLDGRRSAHATHEGGAAEHVGPDVRVAVSHDGGASFQPSAVADMDTCPCCRTDLAAGPDGSLYVAWRELFPGNVRDVVVARSGDGGATWDPPVRVHEDGWVFDGCPHAGPALAVAPDGALHVAWYTGKEGASGLFHAASTDGGRSFSAPQTLIGGDAVPPSQVELGVGAEGRLWAAWESRGVDGQKLLLATDRPGAAPSGELTGTNPSLAAGGGHALVAFLRGDSVLVSRLRR